MEEKERTSQQFWEDKYQNEVVEELPYYYADLDDDLKHVIETLHLKGGTFLDLGTGPATQAMELARLGFEVTATDISPRAIALAQTKAQENQLNIHFQEDDILKTTLSTLFDYIFDRGCFHTMGHDGSLCVNYVQNIKAILKPQGFLFLKCFSHEEPGDYGPHRFTPTEVTSYFEHDFDILSLKKTVYQGNKQPLPKALFLVLRENGHLPVSSITK